MNSTAEEEQDTKKYVHLHADITWLITSQELYALRERLFQTRISTLDSQASERG